MNRRAFLVAVAAPVVVLVVPASGPVCWFGPDWPYGVQGSTGEGGHRDPVGGPCIDGPTGSDDTAYIQGLIDEAIRTGQPAVDTIRNHRVSTIRVSSVRGLT